MLSPGAEQHDLYHGTSWETAQIIQREGFKPSSDGLLGPGTYVAHADKASRFAANCPRHGGDAGAVVKVRITFTRAKYVSYNDRSWISEGFDACRAERTSSSPYPEWCLKSARQVEVLEIRSIACGSRLPAFEGENISLAVVRQKAKQAGLEEVHFSQQHSVASFATDAANFESPRVNVYYETGTVIDHPRHAHVELVRRKVDAHKLEAIFRELTGGSAVCHCSAPKRPAVGQSPRNQWTNAHGAAQAEEEAVRAALEKLRQEVSLAESVLKDHQQRREEKAKQEEEERRQAVEMAQREEAERQRKAAEAAAEVARQEAERQRQAEAARAAARAAEKIRVKKFRGTQCTFVIDNEHASEELRKRKNSIDTVTHLTLVGNGFFMARENGSSFWSNLPFSLGLRLQQEDLNTQGAVKYVAAGPGGQYWADVGTATWWSGTCSESFEKAARSSRTISKVAFGENLSWIVLYDDGTQAWQGIPTKLHNKLNGRGKRLSKPVEVTLGRNETWYVKFADGTYDYVLPSIVAIAFEKWSEAGWSIKNVVLNSENGDYLLRYA